MKIKTSIILLLLVIISCKDPFFTENSHESITLRTDKTSYTRSDSVKIVLWNGSDSDFIIGLRCNEWLEMWYQKKENDCWSDNLWFWYMSFKCPTFVDTLHPNNAFSFSISSEKFKSVGTYRLTRDFNNSIDNMNGGIYSNSFEIK